jgi:RNA polymerase sigma-70 factor (ECF subfamily)
MMSSTSTAALLLPFMADVRDQTPAAAGRESAESSFALLLRAKAGNQEALERLCARYLPRLKRWAHGRLPASSRGLLETQDLVQEVLYRAVQRVETFEPQHEGAFQAYIRQMLFNRIRDEVRRGRRRPGEEPIEEECVATDPSPLELTIGREALDRYEAALERLSPRDRELIFAKIELGFTSSEIAEALGKPTSAAAHMAVTRALVRLAQEMSHG